MDLICIKNCGKSFTKGNVYGILEELNNVEDIYAHCEVSVFDDCGDEHIIGFVDECFEKSFIEHEFFKEHFVIIGCKQ